MYLNVEDYIAGARLLEIAAWCHELEPILDRIRGDYRAWPSLRLTVPQVRRLWNLDHVTCETVLAALLEERFLRQLADGRFAREISDGTRLGPSGSARSRVDLIGQSRAGGEAS